MRYLINLIPMHWKAFLLLTVLGTCFFFEAYSQKMLAVDTPKGKRYRFYKGDYIRLNTNLNSVISGHINSLETDSIVIGKSRLALNQIDKVHIHKARYGLSLSSKLFLLAGIGSFTIGTINGVVNNDSPVMNQNQIITSTSLVSLGLIAALLNQRNIKIKEDWQIKILDLSID